MSDMEKSYIKIGDQPQEFIINDNIPPNEIWFIDAKFNTYVLRFKEGTVMQVEYYTEYRNIPPRRVLVKVICPECNQEIVLQCFEPDPDTSFNRWTYEIDKTETECNCFSSLSTEEELETIYELADEEIKQRNYWFR